MSSVIAAVAFVATALAQSFATGPVLQPEDAQELSAILAEATEEQDICYGWRVFVADDGNPSAGGTDIGSNLGPGTEPTSCPKWVVFQAEIHYTSESSEQYDSAAFDILSNLDRAPRHSQLEDLGISEGALLSDRDDLAVIDATSALPLLVADLGLAPPVALEPNTQALPASDRATGRPGSDWLRTHGSTLGLASFLLILGLGLGALALMRPTWITDLKEASSDAD